jgi:cytochrome b6-f complex iron-sulfur subunit
MATAVADEVPPPPTAPPSTGSPVDPTATSRWSTDRRSLLVGLGGLIAGGVLGATLRRSRTAAPLDEEGLPTAEVEVGDAREIAERLADGGAVMVPEDGGRIAIVGWDPSYQSDRGSASERYGPDGENHPILDGETGLLALSLISTHLGCAVALCDSSGWFEDPCHGARWNTWGEWVSGPAPRGLDRFVSWVRDDGVLVVELTRHVGGPHRELGVLDEQPRGPVCVGD